tara:strand:- start:348906 stop:349775 length:870 start_codon:yes stop_codon:yes gene_type:complete
MTAPVIVASDVRRAFGPVTALAGLDLTVNAGSILGVVGPNGAGKTTLLRALLGLTTFGGTIAVSGLDPRRDRASLMQRVSFIADTAVLPRWMRVDQLLDYVAGVHPRFDRSRAEAILSETDIGPSRKIAGLSKGMTVQLHLALVMSIDAQLLILDEPTLGLDIIFRKRFFEQLLSDYHDGSRTIIISTHQVEEVQDILTDVMFMAGGRKLLQASMAEIEGEFVELLPTAADESRAAAIPWLGKRPTACGTAYLYQGISTDLLAPLGQTRTPSIADLFIALVAQQSNNND